MYLNTGSTFANSLNALRLTLTWDVFKYMIYGAGTYVDKINFNMRCI